MAEDQLLARAQTGDQEALEELCRREWRSVYGVVYQAVRNPTDAQDMTQEVFLRALKSLDRYRQTDVPFHAYLATIARNLVRDRWRLKLPTIIAIDDACELPTAITGPEEAALSSADRERVKLGLATLPSDYQTVIRLRVLEGRPTAEVANLMNRNAAAVRQLQHRAIAALRSHLLEESRT